RSKYQSLSTKKEMFERSKEKYEQEIKKLKRQLDEQHNTHKLSITELNDKQLQLQNLEEQNNKLKMDLTSVGAKLNSAQQDMATASEQMEILKHEKQELEGLVSLKDKELDNLKSQLEKHKKN